jgi:hypothetical protein
MLSFLIRLCASASAVNPGFPILRAPETVIKNRTDRPFLPLTPFLRVSKVFFCCFILSIHAE